MKRLIFNILLSLFPLIVQGQSLCVKKSIYSNSIISINIYSNQHYSITSQWYTDNSPSDNISENDTDFNTINWAEGAVKYQNDTIICIDSKSNKKIYLRKKNNDILRAIQWSDYKNKKDKGNWHKGWNNKENEVVYMNDLLLKNQLFYLIGESEQNINTQESKLLSIYKWISGSKVCIYEAK